MHAISAGEKRKGLENAAQALARNAKAFDILTSSPTSDPGKPNFYMPIVMKALRGR
ncbi:MAG: hypothetical protein ACYDHX_12260 [Methanothrix sp.]